MIKINTKIIKLFIILKIIVVMIMVTYKLLYDHKNTMCTQKDTEILFGDNVLGYGELIVPNIVHFIRFGSNCDFLDFVSYITLKSVLINQNPEKIYIHCNCTELSGKYWHFIRQEHRILVRTIDMPTHAFDHALSKIYLEWHASDVTRLEVLMQFGGIYLDNDVYVLKSLDKFRIYEMSIGFDDVGDPDETLLGNQVLVAHKDARFLRIWHNLYHQYDPSRWYYNAGELPTKELNKNPQLIHKVNNSFGANLFGLLYDEFDQNVWNEMNLYSIHLMVNHRYYLDKTFNDIEEFDEDNIKTYPKKFGELARLMYYGTDDYVLS